MAMQLAVKLFIAFASAFAESIEDFATFLGDECMDRESCSLYALQTQARKTSEENLTAVPDLKEYNIDLKELGRDELVRLIEKAQEELRSRDDQASNEILQAAPCHSSMPGEKCHNAVSWAKKDGIYGHPDWYPGLSSSSSFEDFQAVLAAKGTGGCVMPCGSAAAASGTEAGTSQELHAAWSTSSCGFRDFNGHGGGSLCFCQLAGNPGCADQNCACPQGCGDGVAWHSEQTVTFKNKARADGCHPSTVLLTSPKSYFSTPADLKSCGRAGALQVIQTLLTDSWNMYQRHVGQGSLNQCFHGSHTASVKYLHIQTFCSYASFHAMPNGNHAVGACVQMHSLNEVPALADRLYDMMQ